MLLTVSACGSEKATVYTEWVICEKNYTPETPGESGRWGYRFGKNGGFVYIFGSSGEPAVYEFSLLRTDENGDTETRVEKVTKSEYTTYEIGDKYTVVD